MDTTTEAAVGTDDLYQQLLHLSDVELLFWGCVLVMALLSLNSIIINIKGLVQEIQENPTPMFRARDQGSHLSEAGGSSVRTARLPSH